jgi:hypothetical protein
VQALADGDNDRGRASAAISMRARSAPTTSRQATTASLPRWLAWVSLVVALALIILPIGWAALLFAFPLWVLVVSYLLWSASPDTAAAGAPPSPAR